MNLLCKHKIIILNFGTESKEYFVKLENISKIKPDSYYISEMCACVNSMTYSILMNNNCRYFQAVRKNNFVLTLKPLEKMRGCLYHPRLPVYLEPVKLGFGSYGEVMYFPTEDVVRKKSLTFFSCIPKDIVKEIAIYSIYNTPYPLDNLPIPKMYGFNLQHTNTHLYFEKGLFTINDRSMLSRFDIKTVMFDLLVSIKTVYENCGVIHCDLKPENIVVSKHGRVQVIDWGMFEFENTITKNLDKQTLFYRSPEIFLASKGGGVNLNQGINQEINQDYNHKIDIFSLGLLFIELWTGVCVMSSKRKNGSLLKMLQNLLGITVKTIQMAYEVLSLYTERSEDKRSDVGTERSEVNDLLKKDKNPYSTYSIIYTSLGKYNLPEDLRDLVSKMLIFNPKYRIDYKEIHIHPFFQYGVFRKRVSKPIRSEKKDMIDDTPYQHSKMTLFLSKIPMDVYSKQTVELSMKLFKRVNGCFSDKNLERGYCVMCFLIASRFYDDLSEEEDINIAMKSTNFSYTQEILQTIERDIIEKCTDIFI
jgi:serine/threonine protein kinase